MRKAGSVVRQAESEGQKGRVIIMAGRGKVVCPRATVTPTGVMGNIMKRRGLLE